MLTLTLGQPSSLTSLKEGPQVVPLTHPGESLAYGNTHIFRLQEDQRLGSRPSLGSSRHSGDRGAGQSVVSPSLQTGRRQGARPRAAGGSRSLSVPSQAPGRRASSSPLGSRSLSWPPHSSWGRAGHPRDRAGARWGGVRIPVQASVWGWNGLSVLGVGAWLTSAAGPASALGHLSSHCPDREQHNLLFLGALGKDRPRPREISSYDHPGSHRLPTSRHRALAPAAQGHRLGAHTLPPRFVYLGSCVSCLAKQHRRLSPGRHKPSQPPSHPGKAPSRAAATPAALRPAPLTSSHLMKRSPWLR